MENGLNWFDGIYFLEYCYDLEDISFLSSNWIIVIFEDSWRNIWVGMWNGLNWFDWCSGIFERVDLWKVDGLLVKDEIISCLED